MEGIYSAKAGIDFWKNDIYRSWAIGGSLSYVQMVGSTGHVHSLHGHPFYRPAYQEYSTVYRSALAAKRPWHCHDALIKIMVSLHSYSRSDLS